MSHTCPFSRCRLPLSSFEDLSEHVRIAQKRVDDSSHNVAAMSPEQLAQEVAHLAAANLRLEASCAHLQQVADSWRDAHADLVIQTVGRPITTEEAHAAIGLSVEKLDLVEHARRELAMRGETDQAFVDSIIAAVQGFSSYPGHSGGSSAIAIEYLHDLLQWRALSPLTRDPAEWIDRTEISGVPLWQNARDPRAMSEDAGRTYWMVDEVPEDSDSTTARRYIAAEPFTATS